MMMNNAPAEGFQVPAASSSPHFSLRFDRIIAQSVRLRLSLVSIVKAVV